jgi:hypothetical protein
VIRLSEPFDIADTGFVKRVVVGNTHAEHLVDQDSINKQIDFLNRCLNEFPKGKIIGQEKGFNVLRLGEHQVVMQYIVYHVGFKRKPSWFD